LAVAGRPVDARVQQGYAFVECRTRANADTTYAPAASLQIG
jgi:hypothetical protein